MRIAVVQVLRGRAHDHGRGVDEPLGQEPRVGVDALAHRMMAHVLDTARDRHVVRAEGNARGGRRHRCHGAGAHPVDGVSRHRGWQAREQRGGASDGEALVSALGGRGDGDIVDALWWQLRIAPQQLANDGDDHVVGARLGVEPGRACLAERCPYAVDEDDLPQSTSHQILLEMGIRGPCYSPVTTGVGFADAPPPSWMGDTQLLENAYHARSPHKRGNASHEPGRRPAWSAEGAQRCLVASR